MRTPHPAQQLRRHSGAAVLVFATVSAAAALARRQPLSWDEAVTVAVSTRPVPAVVATLHHSDAVLGLYYLLVHGWGSLLVAVGVHPTESWWRVPSTAAAVATCVVVARIARHRAGPAAGLWAGTVLAVLPLFSFYTVDARPYTLAALTVVCAWAVWTEVARVRRPLLSATIVVLLLVTAAWLQLFTVLVWPAFALVADRRSLGRTAAVLVAAAGGVAPLGGVAVHQGSEIGWIPPATVGGVAGVAVHAGGGLAVTVLLLALAGYAVRARPSGTHRRTTVALAWWCCAPIVALTLLDVVRPVLVARYVLVSLPMVAVVTGVVVARAAPRPRASPVRVLGAALVVAALLTSVLQDVRPWKYEDYRGAAAFAVHDVAPGTPVLFAPSSARLGFDLYAPPGALRDLALPEGPGVDPLAIAEEPPPLLREQLASACRVVLVGDPVGGTADTPGADRVKLADVDHWHVDVTAGFGAVTVTVLTDPACTAHPSPSDGRPHTT